MNNQIKLHVYDSEPAAANNTELASLILALTTEAFDRRSHFFNGRYENLYIDPDTHPGFGVILDEALNMAAELLHKPSSELQAGFWINLMHKGDVTTRHSHDDDDELLAAVYYVQVPAGSGLFKLQLNGESRTITPLAGRFMFFDPGLAHEVTQHQSEEPRISIGINIGPRGSSPF